MIKWVQIFTLTMEVGQLDLASCAFLHPRLGISAVLDVSDNCLAAVGNLNSFNSDGLGGAGTKPAECFELDRITLSNLLVADAIGATAARHHMRLQLCSKTVVVTACVQIR